MSSSKAITTEQQDRPPGGPGLGPPTPEVPPSRLREDDVGMPRTIGMAGAVLVFASTLALVIRLSSEEGKVAGVAINSGWAMLLLVIGACGLLYHAAFDRDVMFRRLYLLFALVLLLVGVVLSLLPKPSAMGDQLRYGAPLMLVALLFFVASLRNEEDESFRRTMELILGASGALLALASLVMLLLVRTDASMTRHQNLLSLGLTLGGFGLVYLFAFIKTRGISDDLAYYAALALVGVGALFGVVTLFRTFAPLMVLYSLMVLVGLGVGLWCLVRLEQQFVRRLAWAAAGLLVVGVGLMIWNFQSDRPTLTDNGGNYFPSVGALLLLLGLAFVLTGGGLASELPVMIMFRRELGAFFLSPITYLVLFVFCIVWALNAYNFYTDLFPDGDSGGGAMVEPIVTRYVINLFPVITVILAAPVLTMSLFSEESRSGTMEVLLTAPVTDTQVLLSKFLAALTMYLLSWLPAALYLLVLRLAGANPFDYRPLLSFLIMLVVWGTAFVAMGIFFSSLTKHMLIAAVLTFAGMLGWTFVYFVVWQLEDKGRLDPASAGWSERLSYLSYIHAWQSSLQGKIVPRFLVFPASASVFFLFLTHKVLESRKWR
jgi:ABC-2 type transport system permease protein